MTDKAVWAMFYASVMGMGQHPGTTRDGANQMTPEQGRILADAMYDEYVKRWPTTG